MQNKLWLISYEAEFGFCLLNECIQNSIADIFYSYLFMKIIYFISFRVIIYIWLHVIVYIFVFFFLGQTIGNDQNVENRIILLTFYFYPSHWKILFDRKIKIFFFHFVCSHCILNTWCHLRHFFSLYFFIAFYLPHIFSIPFHVSFFRSPSASFSISVCFALY